MAKIEHISCSDLSFVVLFRPGCSLCPMVGAGVFIFQKNGVSYISSFWGLDYYQGCKIELSWVKEVVFFIKSEKVCVSLKFIILKIKDPWLVLTNCQTYHFNFFIKWTQFFLFIGPESDHCLPLSLTHSLTDWLTDSLLFSKLD